MKCRETERRWVAEQSGIIGHDTIRITADDTLLTGAIIANAARDENGNLVDQGNLQLKTNTLTVNNLHDVDRTKTIGANLAVGINVGSGTKVQGTQTNAPAGNTSTGAAAATSKGGVPVNSITAGGLYNGHVTERTTFATLGLGQVEVGGELLTDENGSAVNRDVANAQVITRDQDIGGLNASVTVDGRWFSEDGRAEMAQQQKAIGRNWQVVATGLESDIQMVSVDIAPKSIADGLKTIDKFSLGLLPFDSADNGGILAQLPVLAGAADIHQKQLTVISADHPYAKEHPELFESVENMPGYQDLDQKGKDQLSGMLVSREQITITRETATFQNFTNGMFNTPAEATVNGSEQTASNIFTLNYNPRHGFLADVLEIGVDKSGVLVTDLFMPVSRATNMNIGYSSGAAQTTGQFMADVMAARGDSGANFAAHSQGNILTQSGLLGLSLEGVDISHFEIIDGQQVPKLNFSVSSYGSPVNNSDMFELLKEKRILYSASVANDGDFVAEFIGGNTGNYVYGNSTDLKLNTMPMISIERWTDGGNPLLLIFGEKYKNIDNSSKENKWTSPHSSYQCVGVCGNSATWDIEK